MVIIMSNHYIPPVDISKPEIVLAKTDGTMADTMMDITLLHLSEGESRQFKFEKSETAFLLVQGGVTFEWNGQSVAVERESYFTAPAACLHTCRNTEVNIVALTDSEIIVQTTDNLKTFFSVLYSGKTTRTSIVDGVPAGGKGSHILNTIFDYDTAPHSNLVLTEILLPQGTFCGAAPHFHAQSEVCYYRFDKPQGFGYYSVNDEAYVLKDHCATVTALDAPHFRAAAPGYPLYFVSMKRHIAGAVWHGGETEEQHGWIYTV